MDEFAIEGRRFTFFASYYNALRGLDDVRRLKLYDAISSYGIAAQEPLFDDPICKAIFEALRPNIENSLKAHEGGKKGGQSKGKNKPNPPSNPLRSFMLRGHEAKEEKEKKKGKKNLKMNLKMKTIPPPKKTIRRKVTIEHTWRGRW